MRKSEKSPLWVVYRMEIYGKAAGGNAVCQQDEWDAMERDHPGHRKLIQAGIASEGDAEKLARSSPLVATHETPKSGPPITVVAETETESDTWFQNTNPITDSTSVGVAIAAASLTGSDESAIVGP